MLLLLSSNHIDVHTLDNTLSKYTGAHTLQPTTPLLQTLQHPVTTCSPCFEPGSRQCCFQLLLVPQVRRHQAVLLPCQLLHMMQD